MTATPFILVCFAALQSVCGLSRYFNNIESTPDLIVVQDNGSIFPHNSLVAAEDIVAHSAFPFANINFPRFSKSRFFKSDQNLVIYFDIVKMDSLNHLFEIIQRNQSRRLKCLVTYNLAKENLFNMSYFTSRMITLLKTSTFFPDNPLFLHLTTNSTVDDLCILGYKLDTIQEDVILKELNSRKDVNCLEYFKSWLIKPSFKNVLNNAKLSVSAVVRNDDHNYDVELADPHERIEIQDSFKSGFAVQILRGMQLILNFTVKTHIQTYWGYKNQTTKRWSGAIGQMVNGEIDLALSSTGINRYRSTAVDFNFGTNCITMRIFFQKLTTEASSNYYSLLTPFKTNLWVAILIWILLNCLLYRIFNFSLRFGQHRNRRHDYHDTSTTLLGITSICQQGIIGTPQGITLRTLYISQLIVGMVLNAAFSGTLVSFLSVQKDIVPTVDELLSERHSFEFAMADYPSARSGVKESVSNPSLAHLNDRLIKLEQKRGRTTLEKEIKRLVTGRNAYISDDLTTNQAVTKFLEPHEACKIQSIPLFRGYDNLQQSTFVRKGSRIKKPIDYSIIKMMETGNVALWRSRYLTRTCKCLTKNTFGTTEFYDLMLAFHILGGVAIVSICLLVVEHIRFHFSHGYSFHYLTHILSLSYQVAQIRKN